MSSKIEKGIWRHFKGQLYEVISSATHTETNETVVVYKALYGNEEVFVRPLSMFMEKIEVENVKVPRFKKLNLDDLNDLSYPAMMRIIFSKLQ